MVDDPAVGLVSIMDHTPGQRQFVDIEKYRIYQTKKFGMTDAEFEEFVAEKREVQARCGATNRAAILALAHSRRLVLASHDDATIDHVTESVADGMSIAEFPTTIEAAQASHEAGLKVLMGGPNLVLGGSHSGNIAACDLAEKGLLDIVSSDYVPMSMPLAAFALAAAGIGIDLPGAIRLISHNPARAAALEDRGAIDVGLRADLVRIGCIDNLPVVRSVWRGGERIV
jgi:alpha-D-ribose 1-methylphosphonate 5-triphosphate diphosphatase